MRITIIQLAFYGALLFPVLAKAIGSRVNLGYATYEGSELANGVNQFLGMRYAAPPTGQRRLRRPVPPLREAGVIQAKQHGRVCYGVEKLAFPPAPVPADEDCLCISVYAPASPTHARPHKGLPVMMWFQGGAFVQLFNPNYNGTGLVEASEGKVIVVTFNYRVGPQGFLASKELEREGNLNLGLHDQRAAIAWVQKHIRHFGGDPNKVTLFGTSIGGGSILLQTIAYRGKPPPDGANWRSGIAQAVNIPPVYPVKDAEFQYNQFLNATNCTSGGLFCLRSLSSAQFQAANVGRPRFPSQSAVPLFPYSPVIDGPNGFFTSHPLSMLESGDFAKSRPLIIGSSHTEGTIFVPQSTTNTAADINSFLLTQFPGLSPQDLSAINTLYSSIPTGTSLFPHLNITVDISPLYYRLSAIYGDLAFSCPALNFASSLSKAGVPVHLFRTNIQDPVEVSAGFVVPHTWEVQAVWGGPEYATQYGALPGADSYGVGEVNRAVVREVQRYWAGFVTSGGEPNALLRGEGEDGAVWERYFVGERKRGLRLKLQTNATGMERVDDVELERCAFWRSVSERTRI